MTKKEIISKVILSESLISSDILETTYDNS